MAPQSLVTVKRHPPQVSSSEHAPLPNCDGNGLVSADPNATEHARLSTAGLPAHSALEEAAHRAEWFVIAKLSWKLGLEIWRSWRDFEQTHRLCSESLLTAPTPWTRGAQFLQLRESELAPGPLRSGVEGAERSRTRPKTIRHCPSFAGAGHNL